MADETTVNLTIRPDPIKQLFWSGPSFLCCNISVIELREFPFPPSDNKLHRTGRRSFIRYKSGEYLAYEHQMSVYRLANLKALEEIRGKLTSMHKLTVLLYFEPSRLFTKTGKPKRIDATNFLKALCDCLSKLLLIDDSEFWDVRVVKCKSELKKSYVDIFLEPA